MNKIASLRSAALVLIGVAMLAGCAGGGPAPSRPPAPDSATLLNEIGQLWVDDAQVPAYGSVLNLVADPSLYATAWNVRLAERYRISLPQLNASRLSDWMRSTIDADRPVQGIEAMETIRLAAQTLADLGQAPAKGTGAAINALRGPNGLYRFDPGQPESWGATNSAFDAMLAAGVAVPTGLQSLTMTQLRTTTLRPDLTPEDGLSLLIPQWQIADRLVQPGDRVPLQPQLGRQLAGLAEVVGSIPPNGISAYVAASIEQIGQANGLHVSIPGSLFAGLVRSDGMLSSGEADNQPDPKTTYYAAAMGRPLPGGLADFLHRTAGPMGWRMDVGEPDSQGSFYASAIVRSLGGDLPRDQLASAAAAWLADSAKTLASKPDAASLKTAFYALELDDVTGTPRPKAFLDALTAAEPAIAAGDSGTVLWAALALSRSGAEVSPDLVKAVRLAIRSLGGGPPSVVALEWNVVRQLGLEDLVSTLHALGIPARLGGAYSARAGVPIADIDSTALGYFADGGPADKRSAAAQAFADPAGYWLAAPQVHDGNVIDLRTTYLGLWLSGRLPAGFIPAM